MGQSHRRQSAPGQHKPVASGAERARPSAGGRGNAARAEQLSASGRPSGGETSELAIFLIERLQAGVAEPLQGLSAESQTAGSAVWRVLEGKREQVDRWIQEGVERTTDTGTERVKPAPAHVIAGLLGLAPMDPTYRAAK